jgi:hypothetical protein
MLLMMVLLVLAEPASPDYGYPITRLTLIWLGLRRDPGINAGLRQEQAKVVAHAIVPGVAFGVGLETTKVANAQLGRRGPR